MVIPSTYNFREAFDTFILNSYQPIILGGFKTFFFLTREESFLFMTQTVMKKLQPHPHSKQRT